MDLPTLNALLRVNGLTNQSSPDNIADVLIRSGYAQSEISDAIAILGGTAPAPVTHTAEEYVAPILTNTRTTAHADGSASIFAGRIGVRQFWLGIALALAVYALVSLIVEVTAVPAYSLISGISLFSPPDLSTAALPVVAAFGIAMAMLLLPGITFLLLAIGLQIRRFHDYGLSASVWLMAVSAVAVGGYVLALFSSLAVVIAPLFMLAVLSIPGNRGTNDYGSPTRYGSVWAALRGSFDESGNTNRFAKSFVLPLLYLEISGLILGFCIHYILPRIHMPSAPKTAQQVPAAAGTDPATLTSI